jgi:hypothetical protein
MEQRKYFVNKHFVFLLFVTIICMLGYYYISEIELPEMFKILLGDKLDNKHNKAIFYIWCSSLSSSIYLIIKDYKKQGY